MNTQTVLPLSLNGDTFNALKTDFDVILRNTLSNMELKGADTAEMNLKLKISLEKEQTRDFEAAYDGAMRDIIKPKFDHAVQSVLQIKDKKDGTLSGNYELVWDADAQKYVMREITNGQMSFDDMPDGKPFDFVDAEYTDVTEQTALEGRKVAQLPPAIDLEPSEPTPFEWLGQFVGASLSCLEAMGLYTVRTSENAVVLSSDSGPDSPFFVPAEKLADHVGHDIVCVAYGDSDDIVNISIECEECGSVLFDMNAPEAEDSDDNDFVDESEPEEPVQEDEGGEEPVGEDDGYGYEEPAGEDGEEIA